MDPDGLIFAVATTAEERAARRAGAHTALIGLGAANGIPEGRLVSFGLAGALHDGLSCGEVIDATRVVDTDGAVLWEGPPLGVSGGRAGTILAMDAVVDDPVERRRLHERTGADAADMESGALARTGRLAGVVRAISDTPGRGLSGIEGAVGARGSHRLGRAGARVRARASRGRPCGGRCAPRAETARGRGRVTGGRVLLASPRSFCAGVDRAIEIVERLLDEHGPPVYVRHQIVHNDHVVGRLERLGAVFVDHEDEIPAGEICVLSAHGVAPDVKARCEERGLRVVDAVCPLVSKVHAEARRYADSGHLVALVGHADHVEVIGTLGERPDSTVVIESPEDALALEADGKPVAVITQTTLSLDDVAPIVVALETRLGALTRPAADDICYATQNRQDAVKRLVEEATLILVIGSTTSSNARRLVEVAQAGRRRGCADRR